MPSGAGVSMTPSGRPGPVTAAWGVCSGEKGLALRKFLGEGGRSQSPVLFMLSPEGTRGRIGTTRDVDLRGPTSIHEVASRGKETPLKHRFLESCL